MHTATYDVAVASWVGNVLTDTSGGQGFPAWVGGTWDKSTVLRYGENPHQSAALYLNGFGTGLAQATQLHGKEMSYNNYLDADAARRAAYTFTERQARHANARSASCSGEAAAPVASVHVAGSSPSAST